MATDIERLAAEMNTMVRAFGALADVVALTNTMVAAVVEQLKEPPKGDLEGVLRRLVVLMARLEERLDRD